MAAAGPAGSSPPESYGTDNDPTVYPGAPENCRDMKDNDLNGTIDDPTSSGCLTPRTLNALQQAKASGFTHFVACFRAASFRTSSTDVAAKRPFSASRQRAARRAREPAHVSVA